MSTELIVVAGGIGSGKSVVCRCIEAMGYSVYNCDARARMLMESSDTILDSIGELVAAEAIVAADGGKRTINRPVLADVVFNNAEKLRILNSIVHEAVRLDIAAWRDASAADLLFVETAILIESRLHLMADEVWRVSAPEELRVSRAMQRDGADASRIRARIRSQIPVPGRLSTPQGAPIPVRTIVNDGITPVLPRLLSLLEAAKTRH